MSWHLVGAPALYSHPYAWDETGSPGPGLQLPTYPRGRDGKSAAGPSMTWRATSVSR
jgi:hypothetical protein